MSRATIDPKLIGGLLDEPQAFDFFHAVHLLEQLRPERAPVGGFADPADEVVRFTTPSSVAFPPSQIASFVDGEGGAPAEMMVNFLGLVGPQGTLPLDYTLYAASRERAGDYALKDFLGLFEHRLISLFFRAWARSHAAVGFSRDQALRNAGSAGGEGEGEGDAAASAGTPIDDGDWLTMQLLSVVGLSTPGLQRRQPVSDEAMLYYAGLLAIPSRPATALEQLVRDFFDVPCEVQQFVGAWYPLQAASQTALGDDTVGLAAGAVAGDEVWDQQGRVRLRIGPLARGRYDEFLPGGPSYDALKALTRFFGDDQFDFEIQLVLAREEAPACRPGADDVALPLGWATWLRTAPLDRDPDDAVFTL